MPVAIKQEEALTDAVVIKRPPAAMDECGAAPGTPKRKTRQPGKELSDPKEPDLKRFRRGAVPERLPDLHKDNSRDDVFTAELARYGVGPEAHGPLLLQLRRWGPARMAQVLNLWTLLGDGHCRPPATPALQVWGPAGTGKTDILMGFLRACGLRRIVLDAAVFVSLGELQARMVEEIRRSVVASDPSAPQALQQRLPLGRPIRSSDRLETALRAPLEHLTALSKRSKQNGGLAGSDKVVVVIDHAQELPRLSASALNQLLCLPEELMCGGQLTFCFVSRLPLGQLGVTPNREPPKVNFPAYTASEAEAALFRSLVEWIHKDDAGSSAMIMPSESELQSLVSSGLMKFAAPFTGNNLQYLLRIGEGVLRRASGVGGSLASLQQQIDHEVQMRFGLPDMGSLLPAGDKSGREAAAMTSALRDKTPAEKRMILAAYIASRVDKDDDMQLFMPQGRSRRLRRGAITKKRPNGEEGPAFLRTPRSVPLPRLLAIYHRLARQKHLLGPPLLETIMSLRDAGLLRFAGDRNAALERDPKIICLAELPLASACAADFKVDLAEYLCNS